MILQCCNADVRQRPWSVRHSWTALRRKVPPCGTPPSQSFPAFRTFPALGLTAGLVGLAAGAVRTQRAQRRSTEELEVRWDPTAPVWSEEDLEDAILDSNCHSHTLVYLHAFGRCGKEYVQPMVDQLSPGFSVPWLGTTNFASGLRLVLPTAPKNQQPWGPVETTWHQYESAESNRVGDPSSLSSSRQRLEQILREEVKRLDGRGERVFVGGLSQGCTAALDVYLRLSCDLQLGGFVGSVGFLPHDSMGFKDADAKLEALLNNEVQRERPVWVQCAEDDQWVPWKELAEPSFAEVADQWPGLQLRTVRGRGHVIDQWEGDLLHEFMQTYAKDAYAQMGSTR